MAIEPEQAAVEPGSAAPLAAVQALARAARAVAGGKTLDAVLDVLAVSAREATGASVALVRLLDGDPPTLAARTVASESPALAAELAGSRLPLDALVEADAERDGAGPELSAVAERASATALLRLPIHVEGQLVAALELSRPQPQFSRSERVLARAAADEVAAALRAFGVTLAANGAPPAGVLELAGEALVAGADEERTARELARLATVVTGARAAVVLGVPEDGDDGHTVAAYGATGADVAEAERARAAGVLDDGQRLNIQDDGRVVALRLGEPPRHALQLFFPADRPASSEARDALTRFGVRAAYALRAAELTRARTLELERARELLTLTVRMNAELSLSHRLDTVLDRVGELLDATRLAVYLREGSDLVPAALRDIDGPHLPIAERLLELALGPFRTRGVLVLRSAAADPLLAGLEDELAATAIGAAVAVPLRVHDEVTGLLAIYGDRARLPGADAEPLLTALGAQLAVALENARLHERSTGLGAELEKVLALERQSASRLAALYEISRSFVQSMSDAAPVDTTLDAIVRTVVDLLGVDAGVIRLPDARQESLVPRAVYIADERLASALGRILSVPQPLDKLPGRRLFRQGRALVLDAELASGLGGAHELLAPFLEKGATAVVLPIASATKLLGTLKLMSLDATRPITDQAVEIGLSVAAQAALAIENARLYEHQKYFTESMQHSLLPRTLPDLPGFRVGAIYASSADLELGGDVYDYMVLPDGRLAVVLGDVTGHGVEAAADMAMAKFVFRSLAREHPDAPDFLAAANDVVYGEIATGKFITLLYLTVDAERGDVICASAGHPPPRVVLPGGGVKSIGGSGLALGIEPAQRYEATRETIPRGASVVLYTDGVIEARRGDELYGADRLDALLVRRAGLAPQDLAAAVIADCRNFAGGDLRDDCAVVVIHRTAA